MHPVRLLELTEKLTFEEPYQAIKFKTKEDVYKYLGNEISKTIPGERP